MYERDGRKITRAKTIREQREPNWNTVNKELTILRQIFEFARKKRIIADREIPIIKNVTTPRDNSDRKPSIIRLPFSGPFSNIARRHRSCNTISLR